MTIKFAAIGLTHNHIYGQVDCLLREGATLAGFWSDEEDVAAPFAEKYPQAKRAEIATAAIFTFIFTWDDFFGPLIYLNDIKTYTVALALRNFVDSTGISNWSGLFAMSVLSLVPVFVFFLFFQRLLIEGIATTGMKR